MLTHQARPAGWAALFLKPHILQVFIGSLDLLDQQ